MEILIGDDSTEAGSNDVVGSIDAPSDVVLRYHHNGSRLGQSRNVNALLRQAAGTHVALLHDDDLFVDDGIEKLLVGLAAHPEAVCLYGLQQIVDAEGRPLDEVTTRWNRRDRRTPAMAGPQTCPLRAALWCQPPNDAFLLRAEEAKRFCLASEDLVGHAVDAHFMIEIAKTSPSDAFVLLPDYVSKYRLTVESVARSASINGREDLFFSWLLADPRLEKEREARDSLLRRISPAAALDAAQAGYRLDALKILLSSYYSMPWLSLWTGFRIVSVLSPTLGILAKQMIDRRKTNHS